MKFLNKYQYFPQIISECEMNGLTWNFGNWGTYPKDIIKYFKANDVKCDTVTSEYSFKSNHLKGQICIVSYWNGAPYLSSLHTVAFYYDFIKQKYYVYNDDGYKGYWRRDLYDIYPKNKFIVGYIFPHCFR